MILVTGATGRVGEQIVRTLCRLKLPVRSLVRKGSEYYWLNDSGCQFFFGDLRDPESLSRALSGCRFLVVASGVRLEERQNHHSNVTVDGHAALFDAARRRGVERVVLVSCQGVEEGTHLEGMVARRRAEELLIESGLPHVILRAPVHEYYFLDLAWQIHTRGRVLLPAAGNNLINPIPTADLALMAAASLDLATVENQVVEVGGVVELSAMEAFEMACNAAGVPASGTRLPGPLSRLACNLGRPVRRYAHQLKERAFWFGEAGPVDGQAAAATFGLSPSSLDGAMREGWSRMLALSDPEEREKRMVHPQFYATIYQPGTARLEELPAGPPPRRS